MKTNKITNQEIVKQSCLSQVTAKAQSACSKMFEALSFAPELYICLSLQELAVVIPSYWG